MRKPRGRLRLTSILLTSMLGSVALTANADPITIPGYTVTDLGPGTPTFSTGANGNGILNASNGQMFAFQQPSETFLEQRIAAGVPLLSPPSYPLDPGAAYVNLANAVMQSSGIVVAVDNLGIGDLTYTQAAYFVQHNADGSWGQPVTILQAYGQPAAGNVQEALAIVGISNTNQALINNLVGDPERSPSALLYNLNTQSTTDLGGLLQSTAIGNLRGPRQTRTGGFCSLLCNPALAVVLVQPTSC